MLSLFEQLQSPAKCAKDEERRVSERKEQDASMKESERKEQEVSVKERERERRTRS